MIRLHARVIAAVTLGMLMLPPASSGQATVELLPVVQGLSSPVLVTHAGDNTNRLFIVEQGGTIQVLSPGSPSPTLFLDITARVRSGGERGLLGLAFHPDFESNRRFFVNYTRSGDAATVIAEYRASATGPDTADSDETVLLTIDQPFSNHNGGMIAFGSDGLLYIGMGDGGSANDPGNRAQDNSALLGKILRIDVDNSTSEDIPYSSPATNPFVGDSSGRDEIYATGLRNPWRFSFDRSTGDLYAGDVGQNATEEIDVITLGGNYGWRVFEGSGCSGLGPAACVEANFIAPVAEYTNTGEFGRCSVTGGYVYRGIRQSLPRGSYVYGDFCSGEIFTLRGGITTLLLDTGLSLSSFGEDEAGEIYAVHLAGSVHKIVNPSASTLLYSIEGRGGAASVSNGESSAVGVGYGRIQAEGNSLAPAGMAVFSFAPDGIVITEASVPAVVPTISGRIYAEVESGVNTGVAIANPSDQAATVSFFFTDSSGTNFGDGQISIAANGQVARFLDESPFDVEAGRATSFTFIASVPVAVVALRGFTNERSEFLITTLPVSPLEGQTAEELVIPHFADGGGWATDIVLVNPTDVTLTGMLAFREQGAAGSAADLVEVTLNEQAGSSFSYAINPRSSIRVRTSGEASATTTGSVTITPEGGSARPGGLGIFRFRQGGVTISEAGVPASIAASTFTMYVEGSGDFDSAEAGSLESGLAIAHRESVPATVGLELTNLDGSTTGVSGSVILPANGQVAAFITQLSGFESLAAPFQGILQITASSDVSVVGLRGRYNARGDFLITSVPPVDENSFASASERLFPHFADGGGYTTQFILFNGSAAGSSTGVLGLFSPDGDPATGTLP